MFDDSLAHLMKEIQCCSSSAPVVMKLNFDIPYLFFEDPFDILFFPVVM